MRLASALAAPVHARTYSDRSSHGYYHSVDDAMVHGPTRVAKAAYGRVTASCRDGTQSYFHHHHGTCSGHGGVSVFR